MLGLAVHKKIKILTYDFLHKLHLSKLCENNDILLILTKQSASTCSTFFKAIWISR